MAAEAQKVQLAQMVMLQCGCAERLPPHRRGMGAPASQAAHTP